MALDIATLQSRIGELEQRLGQKDVHIEALKAEVLRLRRWRFGRSAERIDPNVAPELPLAGGEITSAAALEPSREAPTIPRLVSVDPPHATRLSRRAARELPADLPRVIRVHAPARCTCPECGGALRQLGEDASEQLDYVPASLRVIEHVQQTYACPRCERQRRLGDGAATDASDMPVS